MKYDIETWNKNPAKSQVPVPSHYRREHWIASMVQNNKWTHGAELGVWRGRTYLYVLANCPTIESLVGVDLWEPQPDNSGPETYVEWPHEENYQLVKNASHRFGKRAIIHRMKTSEAAKLVKDKSLDFIFVDADHSTEAVREDILTWMPKVKDTGVIIGHDINWPTVKIVADDLLPGYIIGPDNAWCRKKII